MHICNKYLIYPSIGVWSLSTNYFQPGVHSGDSIENYDTIKYFDYRFTVPLMQDLSYLDNIKLNTSSLEKISILHKRKSETIKYKIPPHININKFCQ